MRRVLRSAATALVATCALVLSGCGAESGTVDVFSAGGWPGMHADARNSDTSSVAGARTISFDWSRPIGGPTATYASIASNGQIFLSAQTAAGCNVFSFQIDSGRKRWCARLAPGVASSTPVVDGAANSYIGEGGAMLSFNEHGQMRWRTPVSGTPRSAQFTGDGNLLVVTQLGQINVLDTQTGRTVAPLYDLIPEPSFADGVNVPRPPNDQGLDKCLVGSPECPVANTPAVDLESGKFYLTLWRPGATQASLVALRYHGGTEPRITEEWSTDALPGGSVSSPAISADGTTVYVNDKKGALWAVDAQTGEPRWSYDLGFAAAGGPSVSADGLLIPAGGEGGHLRALRDDGDHAESVWERTDLLQLGVPAQTAGGTGYTVVRDADGPGLAMLTFDTGTGATLDYDVLPGAQGFTVGTSIGPDGQVVTTTLLGELFVLR